MKHSLTLAAILVGAVSVASTGRACSSCGCSAPAEKHSPKKISTQQMAEVVKSKSAIVVDARGKRAEKAHIPGAKALSSSSSAEEIAQALPDKNAAIVTYCGSTTCSASPKLAAKLAEMGYTNIQEYPEGIAGWQDAGNKVASGK